MPIANATPSPRCSTRRLLKRSFFRRSSILRACCPPSPGWTLRAAAALIASGDTEYDSPTGMLARLNFPWREKWSRCR